MMNQTAGWMSGQMLVWVILAVLVVAAVVFRKLFRKKK
jgi:uncharacterized membrane protein